MPEPTVVRQDQDAVRILLLNRPPSNSLSLATLDLLAKETRDADQDPKIRCLVLGSTNPKYFSSGLDLEEMLSLPSDQQHKLFKQLSLAHRALSAFSKPTVAAMGGHALLGGLILALGCDVRYSAENAGRIALSEIRLGLSPTTPLIQLVFALTGRPGLIKDLVLQGKTLKTSEAFEAGLIDEILPQEGFMDHAVRKAQQFTKLPQKSYAAVKRAVRATLMPNEDALWAQGAQEFQELFSGPDAREGLLAMKEKRKPRWE